MNRSRNHQRSADRSQSPHKSRLSPPRRRGANTADREDPRTVDVSADRRGPLTPPVSSRAVLQVPLDGRGVIELMDSDGLPGGPAPTQVFVDAVAMAAGLVGWAQGVVCYTPAIVYPGVCPVHELMQASLAISDAHRADGFATAAHYMVGRGTDGGAYIFLVPGVCTPRSRPPRWRPWGPSSAAASTPSPSCTGAPTSTRCTAGWRSSPSASGPWGRTAACLSSGVTAGDGSSGGPWTRR